LTTCVSWSAATLRHSFPPSIKMVSFPTIFPHLLSVCYHLPLIAFLPSSSGVTFLGHLICSPHSLLSAILPPLLFLLLPITQWSSLRDAQLNLNPAPAIHSPQEHRQVSLPLHPVSSSQDG
jgi:hypothetical protein